MHRWNTRYRLAASLALTLIGLSLQHGLAATPLSEARTVLEKWVETRQVIAKTKADWHAEKETLEATARLFEGELTRLQDQTGTVTTNTTQAAREQTGLEQQKEVLDEALEKARSVVTVMEARIQQAVPALPPPLQASIGSALKKIPANPAETKMSVLERMQNVVGIAYEIDKFNGGISVESEVRQNPSGIEEQVRTLYLGLGQAYFVNKSGSYAGVGVPTPQGWTWQEQNELAGPVQRAMAIYENSQPAAFVGLPVQIK